MKMTMKWLTEPIRGHDAGFLRRKAQHLKQTDGEGWAAGEMLTRACDYLGKIDLAEDAPVPDKQGEGDGNSDRATSR